MAATECKEAAQHANLTAGIGNQDEWDCPYIVHVDSARDDGRTIVDYFDSIGMGLGSSFHYGDRYEILTVLKSISPVRRANSVFVWDVTLHYAPITVKEDEDREDEDGNFTDNPLDYRWDVSCGIQFTQVPVWQAWNVDPFPVGGAGLGFARAADTLGPVHNSAGIVLDPPLMRNIRETVLRVTGNVSVMDQGYLDVANCINQHGLAPHSKFQTKYSIYPTTWGSYCVLCNGATAQYRRENGISYWQYTYEFIFRRRASATNPQDGFLETVLDRGITRLANGGAPDGFGSTITGSDVKVGMAEAAAIRDWQGERVPELVLLDGHGQPLQGSDTHQAPPVYFRWRVHEYAHLDFLGLPLMLFRAG